MSFRSFLFLACFTKPYHRPHLSMCCSPLLSLQASSCSPHIDERLVLDQISHLFPIPTSKSQNPVAKPIKLPQPEAKPVDASLPAEDKLRGVFFQKLKSKAAIETALFNVGADVIVRVLGKILTNGNLSGESMVRFFNWAIKQAGVPNDVGSYHVIVKALGRRKFFVFMMGVLCDMRKRGIDGDLLMLSFVIDSFVRAGHVSRAIQIFGILDDLGVRRDTEALNVLLSCLCHRSRVGAANSVLN